MNEPIVFHLGDYCFVRHTTTEEERYGKVLRLGTDGHLLECGLVEFHDGSRVWFRPGGDSFLGYFTIDQLITPKEFREGLKADAKTIERQQQIKDWLEKRRSTNGLQREHQDTRGTAPLSGEAPEG